ncbi:Phospholipase/Carboxylesterase [Paracoccus haematequi]|uniref:Phospholipase/Carboxylesterase n=1 Tax=Paracoccus haematequi TaxID=2491866 RepID=A0A3S4GP66_9RHOB|nr:phospholipase [Paracoccus haematequi]VDS07501.1 Phospholipase/Carboxylesterase [Paracoccus haematequi]
MTAVLDLLRCGADLSAARALCVLVHGRGQSPEEMQSHVLARLDAPGTAFLLPRAPGASWYAARAVDPLTAQTRAALADGLAGLRALIRDARAAAPGLPLVLAGFSQGACLSLEYAFAGQDAPDALAALTGCRVGVAGDARADNLPPGLPVYLTGSDADPWIPVEAFAEAAVALGRSGAALRADLFPGRAHEVSGAEIAMLAAMLGDMAAGHAPRMAAAR